MVTVDYQSNDRSELLFVLQEEKERKELEDQRKKLDEDAKKKKALTNMSQQYGGLAQRVNGRAIKASLEH